MKRAHWLEKQVLENSFRLSRHSFSESFASNQNLKRSRQNSIQKMDRLIDNMLKNKSISIDTQFNRRRASSTKTK